MKKILTLNCEIPGGFGQHVDFFSRKSLLDGEIVLFSTEPFTRNHMSDRNYEGQPLLRIEPSSEIGTAIQHWRGEFEKMAVAGKTVFVLMAQPDQFYLRSHSNRQGHSFESNYSALPTPMNVVHSEGREMTLSPGENILREYWEKFGSESRYQVYINNTRDFSPLLTTRNGGLSVAGIQRFPAGGAFIVLPWIDLSRVEFRSLSYGGKREWTSEAKGWGSEFIKVLSVTDDEFRYPNKEAPPPDWVSDANFMTLEEEKLTKGLSDLEDRLVTLQNEKKKIIVHIKEEASLKRLLYAQGPPLEDAIISAMKLLGFTGEHFVDAESEFDGVFECPEGRMIGEAEGKDNRPINIDKMRQLETNLYEDFERGEVSEFATGLLFGNAFRLTHPSQRSDDQFTQKCKQAAKRNGAVLIRTCDLFEVAKAMSDGAGEDFATDCRKAILAAKGEEVQFSAISKN